MFASSVLMFGRGDEKLAVSRVASLRSTTSLYALVSISGVAFSSASIVVILASLGSFGFSTM